MVSILNLAFSNIANPIVDCCISILVKPERSNTAAGNDITR